LSAIANINNLKKTKRLLVFLKPDKNQTKKIRELETLGFLTNVCEWGWGDAKNHAKSGKKTKCSEKQVFR